MQVNRLLSGDHRIILGFEGTTVKRYISLILLLMVATSGLALAQQKGPRILVVRPLFDYGYVPDSSKIAHTYWINNIGTDTLKIFNVKLTCGCTKAAFDKATVAVNDSVPLEIVFDNLNRLKKQTRHTAVLCNDPADSRYQISFQCYTYVTGESTGPLRVTKNKRLRLTTNDLGKEIAVTIKNVSQKPLEAKLVSYPTELISVLMPAGLIAPGAAADILVEVAKDVRNRNQLKSFTFEMNDDAKSRYTIPVRLSEPLSATGSSSKRP